MIQTNKKFVNVDLIVILLLYLQTTTQGVVSSALCPIGFSEAHWHGETICFKLKAKETFADKYQNCLGNRFTLELYHSFEIPPPIVPIWTPYKTAYDGGPFVDWSYTNNTGELLESTYKVHRDSSYSVNEELCVILDPVLKFTAVRCTERYNRYCFLDPYPDETYLDEDEDCDDFVDPSGMSRALRFISPISTCLMRLVAASPRRTTWKQSQKLCTDKGGSLLNRGWIYSNYPSFSNVVGSYKNKSDHPIYPLGITFNNNFTILRYDHDLAQIPKLEWYFRDSIPRLNERTLGAINNSIWQLVDKSYVFYDIICEKSVPLRHVNLTLSIKSDKIILTVNDTYLTRNDILCFTDSYSYYPQKVNINIDKGSDTFVLKPKYDGYYWCTHWEDYRNSNEKRMFHTSESNKVLYIKVKEEMLNIYAVKLTHAHDYDLDNIDALVRYAWRNKLAEYVYSTNNETITKLREEHIYMETLDVVQDLELKRIYLNSRTALLHIKLPPDMKPVKPGSWMEIQVEYMKPAYFCEALDGRPRLALGETRRVSECAIYNCIGNFNEGVQIQITAEKTCLEKQTFILETSIYVDDVTSPTPTPSETTEDVPPHHQQYRDSSSDSSEEERPPKTEPPPPAQGVTTNTSFPTSILTTSYVTTEEPTTVEPASTTVEPVLTTMLPKPPTRPPTKPPAISTTPTPVITAKPTFPPTIITTTHKPPQEQLQQVIDDLDTLLNNTDTIMVADINHAFDQVDVFLGDQEDLDIPGDLLHLLDRIGSRIDLNGSNDVTTVRDNIALLVADAAAANPVRGLRIANRSSDMFTDDAFEIIREDINSSFLMSESSEVVVRLPESVATTSKRISFVVFRNDRAFQSAHGFVNSRILSVNVENITEFPDGEVIDIHLTPLEGDPGRNQSRSCAYWHFNTDGSGYWSEEGCTFIKSTTAGSLDMCRCDHLTHFAEILIPRTVFSERNENALEIISIIGCCLSIFGLILVGVTAILFRSWRRDYSNKIWLQLCISIFILSLSFLIIVFARFDVYDVVCMLTGILLHYSTLSSFCWMLVAAVLSYRRLVKVFARDASHKLLRAAAFAWGFPFAVIGILLSVNPHAYAGRFDDKNPVASFCYPTDLALWLSVYVPIGLMLLANWTLFALIVCSLFATRKIQRHGDTNEALRCASVSFFLVFLFGLPWVFGLFAMNIVMAYLYAILCTFQGFILFLFFVLGNKNTRGLWLNKLKITQSRKVPVTSSTYTNNRSIEGNSSRAGNQSQSIEAKVSKPRSLASSDDSRFS